MAGEYVLSRTIFLRNHCLAPRIDSGTPPFGGDPFSSGQQLRSLLLRATVITIDHDQHNSERRKTLYGDFHGILKSSCAQRAVLGPSDRMLHLRIR